VGIPMMHFHGTADATVKYTGDTGVPPVDSLVSWWVKKNNCNPTPVFTAMANINTTDSSTVEKYYYSGGKNNSEVTLYKILNGGHTWPGTYPYPPLGTTNLDIVASKLLGSFFQKFCALSVEVNEVESVNTIAVSPNPSYNKIKITSPTLLNNAEIKILNLIGKEVYYSKMVSKSMEIDLSNFSNGIYLVQVNSETGSSVKKIVISGH
jgi:polyhydroxybutyrate depolymerase